ncbi:MAG TPA: ribosome biogenesis GTP-binding protein YihA/YsxC [Bacteroidales bacterium]|nr:ribosome biogenesis GTP-binding protein YihA/YsxC [Bacteroidales bacterium]
MAINIKTAKFVKSSENLAQCPVTLQPEFAFIGRSNVGKSSLINMLTGVSHLAKVSSTPGKTRTINHFIINDDWYIADLPGYGYAKVSAGKREKWNTESVRYILGRKNLVSLFVLLDSRIPPQDSDIRFMEMLGLNLVPFARIFTKTDKLSSNEIRKAISLCDTVMLEKWEELPPAIITSSARKTGREEVLEYIEQSINNFRKTG